MCKVTAPVCGLKLSRFLCFLCCIPDCTWSQRAYEVGSSIRLKLACGGRAVARSPRGVRLSYRGCRCSEGSTNFGLAAWIGSTRRQALHSVLTAQTSVAGLPQIPLYVAADRLEEEECEQSTGALQVERSLWRLFCGWIKDSFQRYTSTRTKKVCF